MLKPRERQSSCQRQQQHRRRGQTSGFSLPPQAQSLTIDFNWPNPAEGLLTKSLVNANCKDRLSLGQRAREGQGTDPKTNRPRTDSEFYRSFNRGIVEITAKFFSHAKIGSILYLNCIIKHNDQFPLHWKGKV